ncbi:LysR family transcriptional regulator [Vibrio mangrovi]|uniref:HTH-type transcriptional regulator YjiE n=1 Tax=Vibrio mangrovi TaxID=474394 RepID=A0A1Y6IQP1_9VIBR|nr:LysR family transcriptional regulator [Vibrio mangrovi]MDW6003257.1 LysR family transcriptional regulator [Vibrio mangrovi]SMR99955.1 HTH-type transcriptional regulator YjiE [Vibrio mangrovi]
MSLTRLRTFVEVYRQRSISAAARNLNLTQPAVSQHIAGLEVAVGRKLFTREAAGVEPTGAADELAADIGDKLDVVESALAQAKARSVDMEGVLQIIGHADFMAEVIAPQLLPLLQSGIRVRMHAGDGDLVHHMLVEGHCDLGFTAHPVTDKRLRSETVMVAPVWAVAAPEVAQRISQADDFAQAFMDEPMLTYNLELSVIGGWLEKNRIRPDVHPPALVSQDLRALRHLLIQGFGWTVLPEYLCHEQIQRGELQQIPAPVADTRLTYYMAWTPSALRQPRIAHARQTLLWQLNPQAKRSSAD